MTSKGQPLGHIIKITAFKSNLKQQIEVALTDQANEFEKWKLTTLPRATTLRKVEFRLDEEEDEVSSSARTAAA